MGEKEVEKFLYTLNKKALINLYLQKYYEAKVERTELETNLAEKDNKIRGDEFWHSAYKSKQDYDNVYAELRKSYDENNQLKQQLAEKEKSIKEYRDRLDEVSSLSVSLVMKRRKDKANFAAALLKKVKDYFCEKERDGDDIPTGDWLYTKDAVEIAEYIDTLIKELKGE